MLRIGEASEGGAALMLSVVGKKEDTSQDAMSSKSRLESMKIIVALVVGLLVSLGTYAQVSQVSTASTQWSHESSRSYEESSPGLGTSRTFASSYGWIDVFSYGLGRSDWR